MSASIGRFGPYIRYGSKFVSLKDADPHTVDLSHALELVAAKKQADLDRIMRTWEDSDVQILKGRWGPFISDGKKNARMPKDREVESLTLEECLAALEAAPDKRRGKKARKRKTAKKKTARRKPVAKKHGSEKKGEQKTKPKRSQPRNKSSHGEPTAS